jgi:hypothetical protein
VIAGFKASVQNYKFLRGKGYGEYFRVHQQIFVEIS